MTDTVTCTEQVSSVLHGRGTFGPPATDDAIREAQRALGHALPEAFAQWLRHADGVLLHDGTCLFGTNALVERSATLEVREFLPGYVAIGDDSGAEVYVLSLDAADRRVYSVGAGVMMAEELKVVAPDFVAWLSQDGFGCITD